MRLLKLSHLPLLPALFAVLLLSCVAAKHSSTGFAVSIAKTEPCGPDDRRIFVLQVIDAGRLRLNHDDLSFEELPKRLEEAFRTRAVRNLLFMANTDLPFSEITAALDAARPQVDYISIVTPKVANSAAWWKGICIDSNLPKPVIDRSRP
jgi:biopolymer transport protein ExbD